MSLSITVLPSIFHSFFMHLIITQGLLKLLLHYNKPETIYYFSIKTIHQIVKGNNIWENVKLWLFKTFSSWGLAHPRRERYHTGRPTCVFSSLQPREEELGAWEKRMVYLFKIRREELARFPGLAIPLSSQ